MGLFEQIKKHFTEPRPIATLPPEETMTLRLDRPVMPSYQGPIVTSGDGSGSLFLPYPGPLSLTRDERDVADAIFSRIPSSAERYLRYAEVRTRVRGSQQTATYHSVVSGNAGFVGTSPAEPTVPIPTEGIKVGEITGWRAWGVRQIDGEWTLISCYRQDAVWMPGAPMQGDTKAHGVHAWKDLTKTIEYAQAQTLCVVGSIALWGDVVEHKRGYRAEFGKPKTLDALMNTTNQNMMRVGVPHNSIRGYAVGFYGDAEAVLTDLRKRYLG